MIEAKFYYKNEKKMFSDPSRIAAYPDGNIVRIISAAYIVNLTENHKLVCSDESEELKYFTYQELEKLNIAETHRHIIKEYFSSMIS